MPHQDSSHSRAITLRVLSVMADVFKNDPHIKNKKEFAQAIDLHATQLSRWVSRKANCTTEDISKVCRRFKVNPTWLVLGTGNMYLVSGREDRIGVLERQIAEMSIRVGELEVIRKQSTRKK